MTTKEIQIAVGIDRIIAGHKYVAENVNHLLNHELDVMSVSNLLLWEYEVKVSRGDFKADKKKAKFRMIEQGGEWNHARLPNYFSYVCPVGLIKAEEVPGFAGLYYASEGKISVVKKPVLIHKFKHDVKRITNKLLQVYSERHFLGNCKMTYLNKKNTEINNRILEQYKTGQFDL